MAIDPRPIVVEQTYPVEPEVVWRAITDPEQMRHWYFKEIEDFKPEVGHESRFTLHNEGRDFIHIWLVKEVVPNQRLAYTFNFDGYDGDALVEWEEEQVEGGTRLTLTASGWETFPQDDPVFQREAGVAGWSYLLGESLRGYFEASASIEPHDSGAA